MLYFALYLITFSRFFPEKLVVIRLIVKNPLFRKPFHPIAHDHLCFYSLSWKTGIKFQSCFLKFDNHRAFFQTKFRAMNKGYLFSVIQALRKGLKVGWGIIYPSHGFDRVTVTDYLTQCQICIGYPLTSQSDPKGPGTSKLGWRYFEHYKVDRN